MRVLHVSAGGSLHGGVETFLVTLARHRECAPGLEPEFAVCFEGRLANDLRAAGATVHELGPVRFSRPWTAWQARRVLDRLVRSRAVDVVVGHGCWPYLLCGPVVRRRGLPLVYWMHDRATGGHWIDRRAARIDPTLVVVNSHATAETLPRLFPHAPFEVLYYPVEPPAVDSAKARADVRAELNTPATATVIVQASRLEPWKGHALLIAALGRLHARPNWMAWIAGGAQRPLEETYRDALRAQAVEAGIADRVRFVGQRSDVPRLLAAADIHCQPNTGPEPFGIAFVEALHAGLPVVSTRLGGAIEIVDGSCGLLVAPDDPAALAEALAGLIDDPDQRRRLGTAGPARARCLCDPAAALARLEAILTSMREATLVNHR